MGGGEDGHFLANGGLGPVPNEKSLDGQGYDAQACPEDGGSCPLPPGTLAERLAFRQAPDGSSFGEARA